MKGPIKIFFCYARKDETLKQKLEKQLRALKRQGLIDTWHDRDITVGADWEKEIDKHLDAAEIVLLLISPDFMDSDYCYSSEMQRAMDRHHLGDALVIPVILRPVYWQGAPFGKLQALPTGAIPATNPKWSNEDEAFFSIAEGIRMLVEERILCRDGDIFYNQEQFAPQEQLAAQQAIAHNQAIGEVGQAKAGSVYHIQARHIHGLVTGNHNAVTQNFNSPEKESEI